MTKKPDGTCSSCHQPYDFPDTTRLHVYLGYIRATNLQFDCPRCGETQTIFVAYEAICRYFYQVTPVLHYDPSPDYIERAERAWARDEQAQDLPEVPRAWSRELWDSMRAFGGES